MSPFFDERPPAEQPAGPHALDRSAPAARIWAGRILDAFRALKSLAPPVRPWRAERPERSAPRVRRRRARSVGTCRVTMVREGPRTMLFAISTLLLAGCQSPYMAFSLDGEEPARRRPGAVETSGMTIAATLLETADEATRYFGHPLPDENVIPVLVHFENRGDRDFEFDRSEITWILPDGESTEVVSIDPQSIVPDHLRGEWRARLGLPLVVPYLLERNAVRAYNFELTRDWTRKSLPDSLRLRGGDEPLTRAIFYRIEDGQRRWLERESELEIAFEIRAGETRPGGEDRISVGLR